MRDGRAGTVAPLPGAADLDALVDSFRRAGAEVRAELHGDLAAVPAATGLAAYRIVQEALTNAVRHAPGSAASVRVEAGERRGSSSTATARPDAARTGSGVTGMRERAEVVGGRLDRRPGGRRRLARARPSCDRSRERGRPCG